MPTLPGGARRVIGPIPPRDKNGRLMLHDKDAKGQPVERDEREYWNYEVNHKPAEEAVKGMKLFQVDLPPEPLALVYAKSEDHAVKVYQKEMGITRFGERDPKVTEVGS